MDNPATAPAALMMSYRPSEALGWPESSRTSPSSQWISSKHKAGSDAYRTSRISHEASGISGLASLMCDTVLRVA